MSTSEQQELDRIRREYERRERELPADYYSLTRPENLFIQHGRERALVTALNSAGLTPLTSKKILEVGCGQGNWLAMFESFGGSRQRFAGVELDAQRAKFAAERFPGADIRVGNAAELSWPDQSFDIVLQSMVISSVLDDEIRRKIAAEMQRVLKPDGVILWYDFFYNNPRNPAVRRVNKGEIASLFPGWNASLRRVTLAPPLARRIVPWCWPLAAGLERLKLLNTHYLGTLRRSS